MKVLFRTICILGITVLAGCATSDDDAVGGVMKSLDTGRTYTSMAVVDDQHTLVRTNVLAMTVDPKNNDTVYIGTDNEGLYISNDAATSWRQVDVQLSNIRNIVVSPSNSQTLYVSGIYKDRGIIIRSDDGGQTWRRVYIEPQGGTDVLALATTPHNSAIYIGTSGGTIARSMNGGESWENLYYAAHSVNELLVDGGDPNTIYVHISGADMLLTRDGGATFTDVKNMTRDREAQDMYHGTIYSMAVSPVVSGVIFVGTDDGVYRSGDYGQSWLPVDIIASSVGIPIHAIAVSPHNEHQIVYSAAKVLYTSVAGAWAITDIASDRVVDVIVHDPVDPSIVYIGLRKIKQQGILSL